MLLIDVHAHLDFKEFSDIETHLARMRMNGITAIVANGINPSSNRNVKTLSEKHDLIKPAYGYYPTHVAEDGARAALSEIEWIRTNKPLALGEIGLDYKEDHDHHAEQQEAFRAFIRLGKTLGVPLIIHSRKAEKDVLDILEEERAEKAILHCFMGKKNLIERAQELGYTFSIPVILARSEQLQWLVAHVPLKQLLTETDSPYLGPVPNENNSPENVIITIKAIAQIKGLTPEEVSNHLYMNYQRLFT